MLRCSRTYSLMFELFKELSKIKINEGVGLSIFFAGKIEERICNSQLNRKVSLYFISRLNCVWLNLVVEEWGGGVSGVRQESCWPGLLFFFLPFFSFSSFVPPFVHYLSFRPSFMKKWQQKPVLFSFTCSATYEFVDRGSCVWMNYKKLYCIAAFFLLGQASKHFQRKRKKMVDTIMLTRTPISPHADIDGRSEPPYHLRQLFALLHSISRS